MIVQGDELTLIFEGQGGVYHLALSKLPRRRRLYQRHTVPLATARCPVCYASMRRTTYYD